MHAGFHPQNKGQTFWSAGCMTCSQLQEPYRGSAAGSALLTGTVHLLLTPSRGCWDGGSPGHVKRTGSLWMCMNCSSLVTVGAFKNICCLFFLKKLLPFLFPFPLFPFPFFFSFFFFLHFFLSKTKKKKYLNPVFLTKWPCWWKNFPILFRHDSPLWTHSSLHDT